MNDVRLLNFNLDFVWFWDLNSVWNLLFDNVWFWDWDLYLNWVWFLYFNFVWFVNGDLNVFEMLTQLLVNAKS